MPYVTAHEGFLILLFSLIPALIYADATAHRIGRHAATFASIPAGLWAFGALLPLLGPAVAFLYLGAREGMIRRARLHPVSVPAPRRELTYLGRV